MPSKCVSCGIELDRHCTKVCRRCKAHAERRKWLGQLKSEAKQWNMKLDPSLTKEI